MLKGVRYFITFECGSIQMIDYWTFIHEIPNRYNEYDYEGWIYDKGYK